MSNKFRSYKFNIIKENYKTICTDDNYTYRYTNDVLYKDTIPEGVINMYSGSILIYCGKFNTTFCKPIAKNYDFELPERFKCINSDYFYFDTNSNLNYIHIKDDNITLVYNQTTNKPQFYILNETYVYIVYYKIISNFALLKNFNCRKISNNLFKINYTNCDSAYFKLLDIPSEINIDDYIKYTDNKCSLFKNIVLNTNIDHINGTSIYIRNIKLINESNYNLHDYIFIKEIIDDIGIDESSICVNVHFINENRIIGTVTKLTHNEIIFDKCILYDYKKLYFKGMLQINEYSNEKINFIKGIYITQNNIKYYGTFVNNKLHGNDCIVYRPNIKTIYYGFMDQSTYKYTGVTYDLKFNKKYKTLSDNGKPKLCIEDSCKYTKYEIKKVFDLINCYKNFKY